MGISVLNDPSRHLLPKENGITFPFIGFFIINTTGFNIPGTASDANNVDQIIQ